MRWVTLIVGLVLIGVGVVWILQGMGTLGGSFMTGSSLWLWMGVACVIVGFPVGLHGIRILRDGDRR